jgi:hypothetical protein
MSNAVVPSIATCTFVALAYIFAPAVNAYALARISSGVLTMDDDRTSVSVLFTTSIKFGVTVYIPVPFRNRIDGFVLLDINGKSSGMDEVAVVDDVLNTSMPSTTRTKFPPEVYHPVVVLPVNEMDRDDSVPSGAVMGTRDVSLEDDVSSTSIPLTDNTTLEGDLYHSPEVVLDVKLYEGVPTLPDGACNGSVHSDDVGVHLTLSAPSRPSVRFPFTNDIPVLGLSVNEIDGAPVLPLDT